MSIENTVDNQHKETETGRTSLNFNSYSRRMSMMAFWAPNPLTLKTGRGDVVAIMVTNCGWINRIDRNDRQDTRTWCGRKCPATYSKQLFLRNDTNHFYVGIRARQRKTTNLLRLACRHSSKSRPERRADRFATSWKSSASSAFGQLQRNDVF